ncbi:MAG: class I SAM-dependent methyltransferase [Candidatus Sericytochromatia bacterium]|nr:class I SAM-dependent methyltransferase [Candidatus Sericytochromatia bacterium]
MSWTEAFFGKYYLKTHLPILTEQKTNLEVDFIESVLKLEKGSKILDIPCGHGRHANQLAKRGYQVTGIDNQPDFIDLAKVESDSNSTFQTQDMRTINFKNEFDAVINLFTSFGYFSEEENLSFLKKMVDSLKIGGKLLIDTVNREWTMNHTGKINQAWLVYPPDNITFLANNSFDVFTSRIYSAQVIVDQGERYEQNQDIRLYSFTEIKMYLGMMGMELLQVFGNMNKDDYSVTSNSMVILCQKIK